MDRSEGSGRPGAHQLVDSAGERKENGKFLIAFADDYGLGNRINIVSRRSRRDGDGRRSSCVAAHGL